MPERAHVVILPGYGLVVLESAAALLWHGLSAAEHPVLSELREAAHEVAMDRTDRLARATAAGSAARVPAPVAAPCSRRHVPAEGSLSVDQAAARLDVTPGRVRQLLRSGDLAGVHTERNVWEIDPSSVEEMHGRRTA